MLETVRPDPIRAPMLEHTADAGIKHGFFSRQGGVSEGLYHGLNVGFGSRDDAARVRENRRRVASWLGVADDHLCTLWQVHSADVIVARAPFGTDRPRADALVTDRPGLALGVLTADCGPVLLADAHARVIGAAHAGWQGALDGVLENVVCAMERLGARRQRIIAVLGPSISRCNYEVGAEFVERFLIVDANNEQYFEPSRGDGHALFDLRRYSLDRLIGTGLNAQMLDHCTYAEEELFFSYRRTTHRGQPDYGRQISAIVIEDR